MPATITADQIREELQRALREAAEPAVIGESVKGAIRRASLRLGLSFGRAKRIWYGEVAAVPAHEADTIRRRLSMLMGDRIKHLDQQIADAKAHRERFKGGPWDAPE